MDSIILGISAFYHDSAAAVTGNGKIIAAAQKDRFTSKKGDPGFRENAFRGSVWKKEPLTSQRSIILRFMTNRY
jgi:predicted NodU family carbamoyl transferase